MANQKSNGKPGAAKAQPKKQVKKAPQTASKKK